MPQLRAFALARQRAEKLQSRAGDAVLSATLKLVGSARNAADEQLIESLKGVCQGGGGGGASVVVKLVVMVCYLLR